MNTKIENSIERFISGSMSKEEMEDFKNRLSSDAEFEKEYLTSLAAHQLITHAGRLELKEKLESFESKITSNSLGDKKVIPLWVKRTIPIAALLVIFFGVYQFTILNRSLSAEEVYDQYYESYSDPGVIRNSENETLVNWETASIFYHEKNFEEAIPYFERSKEEGPSYLAEFYIGVSLLSQEPSNYELALISFEEVLKTDNDFHQQSLWYKGLALLKANRLEEATDIFENIVDVKGYKHLKAKEIIDLKIKN